MHEKRINKHARAMEYACIWHTLRKIGNWGAHPQSDPLKDVTLDDAGDILKFTSEFLDEVFIQPARLDALKRKKGLT